jgi:hypothetical protein
VTVNATIAGANISLTPSFIGVQPARYTDANGNTVRPLGDIEDEAFALVNTLDATQQQTCTSTVSIATQPTIMARRLRADRPAARDAGVVVQGADIDA